MGLLFLLWLTVFYFLAVVCILLSLSGAGTQKAESKFIGYKGCTAGAGEGIPLPTTEPWEGMSAVGEI